MKNVIQLKPCANASLALRNIAEMLDSGELEASEVTVIAGIDVFQCGQIDDCRATENAIFSMTLGIQRIMQGILDSVGDKG